MNASKYNDSAAKRIEIGAEQGTVYVRDNGIGIDPADHERVFELFRRGQRKPQSKGKGTSAAADEAGVGLGLALVRNIVQAHGGEVWIQSSLGAGTTVLMRFPPVSGDADHSEHPRREHARAHPHPSATSGSTV